MTDNEIIKACRNCLHYEACLNILTKAFPNISQNEIDIVTSRDGGCIHFKDNDIINRQKAEIERLKERADRHLYNLKAVLDARRADTRRIIEEFADIIVENYPEMEYFINNLVKEFTEGER